MKLFDCNCSFGIPGIPVFRIARNASELIEEMDFCGIDNALVQHASMRFDSPIIGNDRIIEGIKDKRLRLLPVWTIIPFQTGELPKPEIFIKKMKDAGVKVLWSFPNEHRYALDGCTFAELFKFMIEYQIPLFVKDSLDKLGTLLDSFPKLKVVAVNQGPVNGIERYLRPLIEKYPNLYIDTSCYVGAYSIEDFCSKYGPDRLLFGTAFPINCSGGSILQLLQSNIPDSYKESIAHGNIEHILKEVKL